MAKYRKKPVVIEAFKWIPHDVASEGDDWFYQACKDRVVIPEEDGTLSIETLEGKMTAQKGDFIIRGVKGEIYSCRGDIFNATYEVVLENIGINLNKNEKRKINCDQVAWILTAIERYLPCNEKPAISRQGEMKKYGLLYEIMESANLCFEDDLARRNATPPDVRDNNENFCANKLNVRIEDIQEKVQVIDPRYLDSNGNIRQGIGFDEQKNNEFIRNVHLGVKI